MRKTTNLSRELKRRALPVLTSAAMVASMLGGIGVTAFAASKATTAPEITMDKDGGTGDFDEVEVIEGEATDPWTFTTPSTDGISKEGYTAIGYTTTDDVFPGDTALADLGTAQAVANPKAETTYVVNANATLKINWVEDKYSVTYKKNDGTDSTLSPSTDLAYSAKLPEFTGTGESGEAFAGWGLEKGTKFPVVKDQENIKDMEVDWIVADPENPNKKSVTLYEVWANPTEALKAAEAAAKDANEKAKAADAAAKAANDAADAADKNATADTVAAAKKAAEAAEAAAKAADAAADVAYEASTDAFIASKAVTDDTQKQKLLDASDEADVAGDVAAKAAESATKAAKKASDSAAAAQKKIDDAAANAKAADGSAKDTPAPKGNTLKDKDGKDTAFVVTSDDKANPTVEYKGIDTDKSAKKVTIPETVTDMSGNVYKVTKIAPNALKNAKGKELTISKNVTEIGKNACKGAKFKKITIKTTKKGKIKIGKGAFKTKNKKCVIKVKGAKGSAKTKLVKNIKKQASKGVTVK